MELQVLGQLTITQDGQAARVMRNAKASALLVYLWRNGGAQSRDALAALLYAETLNQQAKSNLRTLLTRLKRTVAGIETTRNTVAFEPPTPPVSDLTQLEQAIATPQSLAASDTALWQGDFLYGFILPDAPSFNEWVAAERERIRRRLIDGCRKAADLFGRQRNWQQLAQVSRRWLLIDPLDEAAYEAGIWAALAVGDRALANRIFERCRQILQEELAIEPSEHVAMLLQADISPSAPHHNLPTTQATLWGRRQQAETIVQRVRDGARLLTLTGLGGVGKTRLALAVGDLLRGDFADGVWFVALAELDGDADSSTVQTNIALQISGAVGLTINDQVEPQQQLLRQLHDKQLLLILDNFEHLIDGVTILNSLLQASPQLSIVATSRERLNLRDEQVERVSGLALPVPGAESNAQFASVQLFADIARGRDPAFRLDKSRLPYVAKICRFVEGLPLAIELAASLIEHYDLDEIADLLGDRDLTIFTAARRDLPERQRSLAAVFDYSWQLLPPRQQRILAVLSTLRGVFDRKAAQAVAGATVADLRLLVDKSLLQPVGRGRYEMHRLLQQFSAENLAHFGIALTLSVQEHFIAYFLGLLTAHEQLFFSDQLPQVRQTLDPQLQNIRQAWLWALQHGDVERISAARISLVRYFQVRSSPYELLDYLQQTVSRLLQLKDQQRLAGLYSANLAATLLRTSRHEEALQAAMQALTLAGSEAEVVALTGLVRGEATTHNGNLGTAAAILAQTAAIDDIPAAIAVDIALSQGSTFGLMGDDERAEHHFRRALALAEQSKDKFQGMEALRLIGVSRINRIDNADAIEYLQRALAWHRRLGAAKGEGRTLHGLATYYDMVQRYEEAIATYHEGIAIAKRVRDDLGVEYMLHNLGVTYSRLGAYELAQARYEERLNRREVQHNPSRLFALLNLGLLHQHCDRLDEALALHQEALQKAQQFEARSSEALAWLRLGQDWFRKAEFDRSADALRQANLQFKQINRVVWGLEGQAALARTLLALGAHDEALQLIEAVLPSLQQREIYGAREPALLSWSCYEVLHAIGDERANAILHAAAQQIMRQADNIENQALRHAFLTRQANNRQIIRRVSDSA